MDLLGSKNSVGASATASTASFVMNPLVIGIVAVLIVAVLFYYFYKPKREYIEKKGPFVLKGAQTSPIKNSEVNVFEYSEITTGLGNNFTISFFVYMDDVNRERIQIGGHGSQEPFKFRPLVSILGVGTIVADPVHQRARIRIQPLTVGPVITRTEPVDIDIPNFMIARWNQLTLTQEGRTVDIYVNGVLVKSSLLENLPVLYPVGVLLETSPDFSGQAGLFQAWPRRLTESEVITLYKRNTDLRGKPNIPDIGFSLQDFFNMFQKSFCDTGICDWFFNAGKLDDLQYVEYEYA